MLIRNYKDSPSEQNGQQNLDETAHFIDKKTAPRIALCAGQHVLS
jgi:hypothetical protein